MSSSLFSYEIEVFELDGCTEIVFSSVIKSASNGTKKNTLQIGNR